MTSKRGQQVSLGLVLKKFTKYLMVKLSQSIGDIAITLEIQ